MLIIQIFALVFLNMAVRALLIGIAISLSVRIIRKNIRHCIMNTWHRCLRIAHGSGQVMSGICLILDVLPEMKAECVDAIIKDLSRLTVKRVKTAFTCTRHIGVKSRWYILQDAVMHSAQVRLLR